MNKGDHIRITEAEGDPTRFTDRTVYAVTDDGWHDTSGTFWPFSDQWRFTLVDSRSGLH